MNIIVDTNVIMSGLIWGGYPGKIINAWTENRLEFAASNAIINEYFRVAEVLSKKYPTVDIIALVKKLAIHCHLYEPIILAKPVSNDPDDDKFIECALAANINLIVSGDSDLLNISGYQGIQVIKAKPFVIQHIEKLQLMHTE